MLVIGLIGVFSSFALPNLRVWMGDARLHAVVQNLSADISYARAEAHRLQRFVGLCMSARCGQGGGATDQNLSGAANTSTYWISRKQRAFEIEGWSLRQFSGTRWESLRVRDAPSQRVRIQSLREANQRGRPSWRLPTPNNLQGIAWLIAPDGSVLRRDSKGLYYTQLVLEACDLAEDLYLTFSMSAHGQVQPLEFGRGCA